MDANSEARAGQYGKADHPDLELFGSAPLMGRATALRTIRQKAHERCAFRADR
jgi:hypothetical protein